MTRLVAFYVARTGLLALVWTVLMVLVLRAAALLVDAHRDLQLWLAVGLYGVAFLLTLAAVVVLVIDARRFAAHLKGSRR